MNDFSFSTIPELVFGTGTFRLLPRMLERYGRHFLLVTGQRSFRESIPAQHFFSDMKNRGFQWSEISVHGEPSAEQIDFAVQQIRPNLPDAVVAIGGGSVIDAGKALAAMLVSPLPVEHYLEGVGNQAPPGNKLPFVAVPTTAGTGSEATKNAVLSRVGEKGYKSSLRHDRYIPDQALIDPELQLSCPFRLTACSGMDAFSQLLESYLSTKASPLTDALALEGLRNVSESLARFSNDSLNDRIFRSKMAYAAWLSGITLANAGLGTVHGFAGSIGARFAIPHGTVCGALMAETNRLILERLKGTPGENYYRAKYAAVGKLFARQAGNKSDVYFAGLLIDRLLEMTEILRIPRLSDYGITSEHFPFLAGKTSNKNNPVPFSTDDLMKILERSNGRKNPTLNKPDGIASNHQKTN